MQLIDTTRSGDRTAVISARVNVTLAASVQTLAQARGISTSELVAELLAEGIGHRPQDQRGGSR